MKKCLIYLVLGLVFGAVPCAAQITQVVVENDTTGTSVLDVTINCKFIGHLLGPNGDYFVYRSQPKWSFWLQTYFFPTIDVFVEACPANEAVSIQGKKGQPPVSRCPKGAYQPLEIPVAPTWRATTLLSIYDDGGPMFKSAISVRYP